MNTTTTAEYRKLRLDSSNDMIEHDADRTLGRYPKAAWHILQAGIARVRMGQMMFDAGNFTQAAADWLSAAACFDLATDPKRMRETLDRVRQLNQEGQIPPERRDIHIALKEREDELPALETKLLQFHEDYANRVGSALTASPETLDWLQKQVRDLPGWLGLHTAIVRHAGRLGQTTLAARHLDWAEQIEPGHPELDAFRASLRPLEV